MSAMDRVGLAWRDELAAQIVRHLASIDHLEVLADREFSASRRRLNALRDLARQVPLSLHGVSLGLVSSEIVAEARLERIAKLVERVQPDHWSEHLAFVRAAGIEIGHLAAAPYVQPTVDGALRNLERARRGWHAAASREYRDFAPASRKFLDGSRLHCARVTRRRCGDAPGPA
jgi:uncharacterized protein (UPF0276 family)